MRSGSVIALYVFLLPPSKEKNSDRLSIEGRAAVFPPTIVLDGLVQKYQGGLGVRVFTRACTDEQILKDEWTSGGKQEAEGARKSSSKQVISERGGL